MSAVIKRTSNANGIYEYKPSVHTPDYDSGTWLHNPDLTAVSGVDQRYWKTVSETVVEMSQAEKDAVDASIETQSPSIVSYMQSNQIVTDSVTGLVGPPHIMNILMHERLLNNSPSNPLYDASILPVVSSGGGLRMPEWYRKRLTVSRVSASTSRVEPGACRSDDNTFDMRNTGNLDADITLTGAGGLDVQPYADLTHYHLWMICNPVTEAYAAMWSLSATAPTLPSGYTKKRLLGSGYSLDAVPENANVTPIEIYDLSRLRYAQYEISFALMYGGNSITFATLNVDEEVPDETRLILVEYDCVRASNETGFRIAEYGKASWKPTCVLGWEHVAGQLLIPVSSDLKFEYRTETASDDLDLHIRGYYAKID